MRAAVLLIVLGGCGHADIADGTIQCGSTGECPPGFGCHDDGLCWRAGGGGGDGGGDPNDGPAPDAPVDAPPDAPVDAVPVACESDAECDALDTFCGDAYCDTTVGLCKANPINQGSTCMPRSCPTGFSACANDGTCNESGSQARTCVDFTCQGVNCTGANVIETQGCVFDTDGNSCGADYCDGFPGGCPDDLADECDQNGSRSRACYVQRCAGGGCGAVYTHSETEACFRGTEGNACGAGYTCPGFDGSCDDCQEARTCTDRRCRSGGCQASGNVETRACGDGTPCAATTCGPWDSADFDCSPGCTDERDCTDYTCQGGGCQGAVRQETGLCTGFERCGTQSCSCGDFDRICNSSGNCVVEASCISQCS